jgi:hypothetical protein
MKKNKKIGMLTKNDKMTTRNNKGVEKACWKHQGVTLNMIFFFSSNRWHQKIEGIGYNAGGH